MLSKVYSRLNRSAVLTPLISSSIGLSLHQQILQSNMSSSASTSGQAFTAPATKSQGFKVAVVGAAGGIGQPLSLLAKQSNLVKELSLYDVAPVTPGVAADLSHINTPSKVVGYQAEQMSEALKDCDVIIVPAGVPRKPGMTRDDLFNINAGIVANIAKTAATAAPNASLLIISNPVNSTVPIVAEVLKKHGTYNKNKLFGVTTLDVVRANTFVSENQGIPVETLDVPVIGGHAGITIIPILSSVKGAKFSKEDKEQLTHRIMFGGDEVVKAKNGGGSATLSMAYAGWNFAEKVLRAIKGEKGIIAYSYVENSQAPTQFFASPVELGKDGIQKIHPLPQLDDFEKQKLEAAVPELKNAIQKGIEFVKNQK